MLRGAIALIFAAALGLGSASSASSPNDDDDRFLRGLAELDLHEVLEHYMRTNPPADDVRAAEFQLALDRMRLNNPALEAAERERIVRRMLARRAEVIDSHPADPRRALWLTDQASDSFFELMPIEASRIASLLGLPSPSQRERAAEAARLMYESAAAAESAIQQALLDLEATPGFADDAALQARRRRLAEEERDRRIPFLHGVGAELHARLNAAGAAERERLHALAHQLLAPLAEILEGPLADEARLHAGLAASSRGRREEAARHWQRVTGDGTTRFAARIALARQDESSGLSQLRAMERAYEQPRFALLRLLLAEAQFRHAARHDPAQAHDAFTRLLDMPPGSIGLDAHQMRDLVLARLTLAIEHDFPPMDRDALAAAPALVVIALAERKALAPGAGNAQRMEAIASLNRLLHRSGLDDRERALALFTLGRAYHEAGQPAEGAARFIQLARDYPRAPEAERAIELGVSIAAHRYREAPVEVAGLLDEGLRLLIGRYPNLPTIDGWRFLAGQVAMSRGNLEEAMAHFDAVLPGSEQWPEARLARVRAMRNAAISEPKAQERAAQFQEVIDAVDEALRRFDHADARQLDASGMAMLRVLRAEAMLALGDAGSALDALPAENEGRRLDAATLAELLRVRLACLDALGRAAEAGETVDRLLRAAPERARQVVAPMMAALERRVLEAIEAGREDRAKELAQAELAPLAARLHAWLKETAPQDAGASLLPRVADAYRLAHRHAEALALYDELLSGDPDAAPLLLGRAECLFHLGDERLADAMLIYRRLIASGPSIGHDRYWLAQLRSLQVLDRVNRNTRQIVPQIQRLREIDPELGGERFRRGFEALQRRHAGG